MPVLVYWTDLQCGILHKREDRLAHCYACGLNLLLVRSVLYLVRVRSRRGLRNSLCE